MSATWRAAEAVEADIRMGNRIGEIVSLAKALAERIHAGLVAHQTRRGLQRRLGHLDDHLLRDIGLNRVDIGRGTSDLHGISEALIRLTGRPDHL